MLRAVQQPIVVKMEVCVCMTRKNNLIHASASPFGLEKLILIWVSFSPCPLLFECTFVVWFGFVEEFFVSGDVGDSSADFCRKDTNTESNQHLYSYAKASGIYGNDISVWLNKPRSSPRIEIPVDARGRNTRAKINDTVWHHICVTWKSTKGAWQLYLDGRLQSNGTGLKENRQSPAGRTIGIRRDQGRVGGGFQSKNSFGPGEVTEVNLWSRDLSASDIAEQYADCHITKVCLMHWWEQFKGGVSNVIVVQS
ncbi:Sushi, von Willebrand factor type A, EGF and pentraxin domain-containing protein 1 [Stylophora pistillata]|uniref:Sushi, von Willebrand factor type A, EGF and pentraxin domain-containing protein 1 n=1 Tax=Stylophora pistillata TaxID=50429 RepID=A0A2B4RE71_STYPI|nr:Sushi, von Willebrand factor type A, EGF and pentraxin domain-containing protein 1 [Stylophora pistillata]